MLPVGLKTNVLAGFKSPTRQSALATARRARTRKQTRFAPPGLGASVFAEIYFG
jgi:hypothetical protein